MSQDGRAAETCNSPCSAEGDDVTLTESLPSTGSDDETASCAAEVVVRGNNMSKIRVKFPPAPPATRPRSARRAAGRRAAREGSVESATPSDLDDLPTGTQPVDQDDTGVMSVCYDESTLTFDRGQVVRQNVINSLNFFEQQEAELRRANAHLGQRLEESRGHVTELERTLAELRGNLVTAENDNNELKIENDRLAKEKLVLEGQIRDLFDSKNELTELHVKATEENRKKTKQMNDVINRLTSELEESRKQVEQQEAALRRLQTERTDHVTGLRADHVTGPRTNSNSEMELSVRLQWVQQELRQAREERDKVQTQNRALSGDLEVQQALLEDKNKEADKQYHRFFALKKSFNDLWSRHNELKTILRRRRGSVNSTGSEGGLSITWPRQPEPAPPSSDSDQEGSVAYVNLPAEGAAGPRLPAEGGSSVQRLPAVPRMRRVGVRQRSVSRDRAATLNLK